MFVTIFLIRDDNPHALVLDNHTRMGEFND